MKEFPLPLRILSLLCLLPALWGITLYLWGGVMPFGTSPSALGRLLCYGAAQALWIVPVVLFFVSLNEERRGYRWRAYLFAVTGVAVGAYSLLQVFVAL